MDYSALIQMAISYMGEAKAQQMSEKQLAMLGQQLAQIQGIKLPDLAQLRPDELGPSAAGSMQSDEAMRGKQLNALGEIQNIIDSGGMNLSDKASVEEALNAAVNQQRRARAGVSADAQARGQMNSGNRLVMDMDAAQQGANAARQSGLEVAGMAQKRRLQAIQDSASMASGMRNQDWNEKEAAARAKDIRDERNAAAREKAQYYNAAVPQQNFTNAMAKATGTQPSANAYGGALGAAGANALAAANTAQVGVGRLTRPTDGNGYTYNSDDGYRQTYDPDKLTYNENDK